MLRCIEVPGPMSQLGHSRPGRGSSGSGHVPYAPKAQGSRLPGDYEIALPYFDHVSAGPVGRWKGPGRVTIAGPSPTCMPPR
jgi:hypothetical protein